MGCPGILPLKSQGSGEGGSLGEEADKRKRQREGAGAHAGLREAGARDEHRSPLRKIFPYKL